jgi:predicted ATP-dependent endonuclease of OLD family
LPEHFIGPGYQNLQSLSFMLVSFRAARLNPLQGTPAAVHLVMVEEPEVHLHVQVQSSFSSNAHGLIRPKEPVHSNLRSQLLISTHTSHLALGDSFTRLRYVRLCGHVLYRKIDIEVYVEPCLATSTKTVAGQERVLTKR